MPYSLYRLYGDEETLLYVGMSVNLPARLTTHKVQKAWWADVRHIAVEHFDTKVGVLAAEREAIQSEHPAWNIQHNLVRGLTPTSPYQEAIDELCGLVPLEDPADRRALAAAFDEARRDDERADGSPTDYSAWPQKLKALVQAVGQMQERDLFSSMTISAALLTATGGDAGAALAEARALYAACGVPRPSDDELAHAALERSVERLADRVKATS